MKISASFLTSNDIPDTLRKLNDTDVDYIHCDIMDGAFVKRKTLPFSEMKHINEFTSKRLDVHLMVNKPSKYIPLYAELNTEFIIFHLESDEEIKKNLDLIKSYSIKCGLAIKPDTNVSELVPYIPYLDIVLVMSVDPGEGGQLFNDDAENKIKEVKKLIASYNLNCIVSVDGGVNAETLIKCKDCDIIVAGSYIINGNNYQDRIKNLRLI